MPADQVGPVADSLLAQAAGRSLLIVVRDAHRYPFATGLVSRLLATRPDATVVEMGLPVWRPATGAYVASYGAARSNALAVAERLGLTSPRVL
jgi:beta-N-acetylhexosaminidase